jgi:hypothetical protein
MKHIFKTEFQATAANTNQFPLIEIGNAMNYSSSARKSNAR